jgi:CcmD family protein
MDNAGYIFTAFGLVWAVVFGYVLYLVNKSAKISRRLKAIEEARARRDEA